MIEKSAPLLIDALEYNEHHTARSGSTASLILKFMRPETALSGSVRRRRQIRLRQAIQYLLPLQPRHMMDALFLQRFEQLRLWESCIYPEPEPLGKGASERRISKMNPSHHLFTFPGRSLASRSELAADDERMVALRSVIPVPLRPRLMTVYFLWKRVPVDHQLRERVSAAKPHTPGACFQKHGG